MRLKIISVENKIMKRVEKNIQRWVFSQCDFSDLATGGSIDTALHRLMNSGHIRRVMRGVYDKPHYSELLQQKMSPDYNEVAYALARKFCWRIQPSGDTALNYLGLSTQIPGKIFYLSDGPSRKYTIGNITIEFKKKALKNTAFKYKESALLVHALEALGQERITDTVISSIRKQLTDKTNRNILKDTKYVTTWIYENIKQICAKGES